MHKILKKFKFNNLLIKEYGNWYLLLREEQLSLGSLVLIEKSFKTRYSEISRESFSELAIIVKEIECVLKKLFSYDKINYLMLMMADNEVHYHIIPRYSQKKCWDGIYFMDTGWPKLVDFTSSNLIDESSLLKLKTIIINNLGE